MVLNKTKPKTERCILSVFFLPDLKSILFSLLLISLASAQQASSPSLDSSLGVYHKTQILEAQNQALLKGLANHPRWQRLLHMYSNGGDCSDFDGGYFFLDPEGRCNAQKELTKTIEAFLTPNSLFDKSDSLRHHLHPLVKFPARLRFLIEEGILKRDQLPPIDLSLYKNWVEGINATRLKLIYATGYMGNPASIMGHVFFRLENPENLNKESLNYSIMFSAEAGADRGFFYAIKGVFGFFQGRYSISQYHLQMQTYLNMEARDLWEYDLNLNQNEIDYFVDHLWETSHSWQDYYFFTENCSYGLLTALEAAKLDVDFSGIRSGVVLPVETLKEIQKFPGLLTHPVFKPSIERRFLLQADTLQDQSKDILQRIVQKDTTLKVSNPELVFKNSDIQDTLEWVRVYDAALDYLQLKKRSYGDEKKRAPWTAWQKKMLWARSQLPIGYYGPNLDIAPTEPPHFSPEPHGLGLNYVMSGYRQSVELNYRFLFHSMDEISQGMPRGLNLEMLKTSLRYTPANKGYDPRGSKSEMSRLSLNEFLIAKVANNTPYNSYTKPLSWRTHLILDRDLEGGPLRTNFDLGIGWSMGSNEKGKGFFTFTFDINPTWEIEENQWELSPGVTLYRYLEWSEKFISTIKTKWYYNPLSDQKFYNQYNLILTYGINKNLSLQGEGILRMFPYSYGTFKSGILWHF